MTLSKKRKTPREKKQLEYTKDHVNNVEYPERFRKAWARKEARTKRAFRRRIHELSKELQLRGEEAFVDGREPEAVRRRLVRKWSVQPMGEVIARRISDRLLRTAWNFYKNSYDSKRDRERFVRFLSSLVSGRSEQSRSLAFMFHEALETINSSNGKRLQDLNYDMHMWPVPPQRWWAWLQAFFRDEPEWEQRLRDWIDSFRDNT